MGERIGHNACPILERTGDGTPCGRCWYYVGPGPVYVCHRHGNVSEAVSHYHRTGKLTSEPRHG